MDSFGRVITSEVTELMSMLRADQRTDSRPRGGCVHRLLASSDLGPLSNELRTVRAYDTIENNFDHWHDAAVARGQSEFALPQLLMQAQEAKALQ